MRINSTNLIQIGKEKSLRNDCVYQNLASKRYASDEEYYTFDELFSVTEDKISYDDINGEFRYCQIGDVGKDGVACPVVLNFDNRNLLDDNYYKKIEKGDIMGVDVNDILISFLLPQDPTILGKFMRIREDDKDIFFSTAFLRLKAKKCPQILYYCLQSLFYNDMVSIARIRKGYTGYATLSKDDLKDMRFSKKIIDTIFDNQEQLSDFITNKEREIDSLNDSIITAQEIIDEIFKREFSFDYDTFEKIKMHKTYISKQSFFSNNPDLRFSVKYHRPAGDFVMKQLTGITDKKIKHFLAEPIVLGASVSPKDYDENGEFSYISMATIKTWTFDAESASTVADGFSDTKLAKTVKKDDIILARSGEGTIGKVAIINDEDIQGIFADFTMRIRLKNYKPTFAYYYFRTTYFQYLIEIFKKGLGNNTNIFPIVIQEFPIPNISLDDQKRIVDEIQAEIAKQEEVKNRIADLRKQIVDISIEAIK